MREIRYTVSLDSITPAVTQNAGFQCEYNATKVIYRLSEQLLSSVSQLEGDVQYALEAINGEGVLSVLCVEPTEVDGHTEVSVMLPDAVTLPGTAAQLQLSIVVLDGQCNLVNKLYTPKTTVKFGQSVAGQLVGTREYERYSRNLVGAMQLAVSAAETATQAVNSAAQQAESAASSSQSAEGAAIAAEQSADSATEEAESAAASSQSAERAAIAAEQSAERAAISAAGGQWELLKEVALTEAITYFNERVELLADTSKGVRVKVNLPVATQLSNNRMVMQASFSNSRSISVRASDWIPIDAISSVCFDVLPHADAWDVQISPYTKSINAVVGDLRLQEADVVRYINLQANSTYPLPIGTTIEIWRLM